MTNNPITTKLKTILQETIEITMKNRLEKRKSDVLMFLKSVTTCQTTINAQLKTTDRSSLHSSQILSKHTK